MNNFDEDMISLGALAESLVPRIKAHVAHWNDQEARQILEDRITVRESLRAIIAEARAKDLLAKRASVVGSIGRATGLADLFLELHADLFADAGQAVRARLAELDPVQEDRAYRVLWIVVNIEDETPGEAIARLERARSILEDC